MEGSGAEHQVKVQGAPDIRHSQWVGEGEFVPHSLAGGGGAGGHSSTARNVVITGRCYWHPVLRGRDAPQHPGKHRMAPITQNDLAPNVGSAEIEKPWCGLGTRRSRQRHSP